MLHESWCLKWSAIWLFVQKCVQSVNKENIRVWHFWPFVPVTGGFSSQKASNMEHWCFLCCWPGFPSQRASNVEHRYFLWPWFPSQRASKVEIVSMPLCLSSCAPWVAIALYPLLHTTHGWAGQILFGVSWKIQLYPQSCVGLGQSITGLILGLHPANERWRYFVTTSLIGWVQA